MFRLREKKEEERRMKIEAEHLFTVTVNKELKNNNTGRSAHWSSAHKEKQSWLRALDGADVMTATGESLDLNTFRTYVLNDKPLAQIVGLAVRRVLGPRQRFFDADSILRGNVKEGVDSFVTAGILSDDNIKHVAWCVGLQDDTRKSEGPFTEFIFYNGAE